MSQWFTSFAYRKIVNVNILSLMVRDSAASLIQTSVTRK